LSKVKGLGPKALASIAKLLKWKRLWEPASVVWKKSLKTNWSVWF
jgi:hypothetical protein